MSQTVTIYMAQSNDIHIADGPCYITMFHSIARKKPIHNLNGMHNTKL